MGTSIFQGDPQKAPSYAATTSDVPQWLQDYTVDLFSNQRAISGTAYQPYVDAAGKAIPRIAGTQTATTAAQNLITNNVGAYQPAMQNAITGTQGLTGQGAGTTAGLGYLQQAAGMSGVGAAQPLFGQATGMATQAGGINTATPLNMTQGQYTNPNLATQNLNLGQTALAQSGQTATANIGAYMNPYTQNVTDQIASLGARNLSENLLPAVSDQFIRAGQFGSSGMGTFGGRALRDTQEAILNQQNQALQAGYGQALGASQADLARQAQLGQTYTQAGQAQQATGIGAAQAVAGQQASDAARQMAAAQELGTIGQQTGALTQAGQQNLGTIGTQTASTAQAEAARQQAAQQQVADLAKMQQGLTTADAAALESVGAAQQGQQQKGLDVAYQDYLNQINDPQKKADAMSATLRGLPAGSIPTSSVESGYKTTPGTSTLADIASAYGVYKGIVKPAKGGLIQGGELVKGFAEGGAVEGDNDLYSSVMADYGQYLGGTNQYDTMMSQVAPRLDQNRNAMTDMAAYHASHAPIASPNTVPAMYKQYNTLKNSINPSAVNEASAAANALQAKYNEGLSGLNYGAVDEASAAANAMQAKYNEGLSGLNSGAVDAASAAANAMQAKYNEGLTALNPSAVTSAADAANAKLKELTDPAAILAAFNSGAYNVGIPQSFGDRNQRIAEINRLVAAGYTTTGGPDSSVWYMKPKTIGAVAGMPPPSKQAEYDKLLNNYNTLNTGYNTGLEKLAPTKAEYDKLVSNYNTLNTGYNTGLEKLAPTKAEYDKLVSNYNMLNTGYNTGVTALAPQKAEYDALMAKYNTLNDAYTAGSAKLTGQKSAYEKALKASEVPSPWGNAMPHLAHGGRVPGYADDGLVDTENPADLVDGGQDFANQYAQGQQDYPAQQDAAVYQGQGPGPIIGREALNALVTKYGGLGDDAIKQLAEINTQRTAARNDYNTQIAKLEAMQPQGPSDSEKWLNFAAAFQKPGSFFQGMGSAATSLAEHNKAKREYDQEFMKNRIMAGLKRGEFTMEDLARQEKSTVDMAQLGISSQEKLAALLEKVNAGEKARLSGIIVHWNDANNEITSVDKSTNLVTTLRVADIPENIRKEIYSDAQARAEQYLPEDKPAKIEQFMKENLEAYAKTRTAVKLGDTAPLQLAPTSTTTGSGVPSHTGSTITPSKGPSFQGAPVDIMKDLSGISNEADKIAAGKQYEQQLNKADVGYTSPFGQYVVAPPRARITTGEQTPQQKIEFEGQAAANLDEVKLFNTRVNEASSAGTEGVAAANQLLSVLPKIPNTGTLAPYRQQLGSVFGSLGIPGDITDSASLLGIAQAAVSSSVLGKQLLQKGVQTESDAKRMEAAGPTLTQPKVALEFLTRTAKASGLRQLEMSAFRDDWRRYNQSDLGMGDAWNKYLNATPMTALMPNNKLMFVNEYVDQYMKAHPTGSPEQRRGAALNDWRKLGGM